MLSVGLLDLGRQSENFFSDLAPPYHEVQNLCDPVTVGSWGITRSPVRLWLLPS